MRKKILILSMLFLLFGTLNYTYSSFKNTIVGNISGNVKDWSFKVNVNGGTKENDYFKVPISSSTGSFIVNLSTTNSTKGSDYNIEFVSNNLPSDIKFCTDGACNNVIENNLYIGEIEENSTENLTIYYKSSSTANGNVFVRTKAKIIEYAFMKNGANDKSEFWSDTYRTNIKNIEFKKSLTGLPSSCTSSNKCWDISESSTQSKKVYAYLTTNSSDSSKYDLHILSKYRVYAPNNSSFLFSGHTNMGTINFNNNFYTSRVTEMVSTFQRCSSLTSLDLNGFDTSNVTNMEWMFQGCSSLTSINLNNFNTQNVVYMQQMFSNCTSLTSLDLSNFNTSNVTDMAAMFTKCSSLTSLDLSNFNTSKVKDMQHMFSWCSSLTTLDLSGFDTSNVENIGSMFHRCTVLTTLGNVVFDTTNVASATWMFGRCSKITATINVTGTNIYSDEYRSMLTGAAIESGTKITINYTSDASSIAQGMKATGTGNIVLSSVIQQNNTITISGNSNINYEISNRLSGTIGRLISTDGTKYVASFKLNGETIEGNKFVMPNTNATITDITTVDCATIQTAHNPYAASQSNAVVGTKTFSGVKSLTVLLQYQTTDSSDYFQIFDSSTATTSINNGKKYYTDNRVTIEETVTINSNYVKFTFTSDANTSGYYGFRAIIIPNY